MVEKLHIFQPKKHHLKLKHSLTHINLHFPVPVRPLWGFWRDPDIGSVTHLCKVDPISNIISRHLKQNFLYRPLQAKNHHDVLGTREHDLFSLSHCSLLSGSKNRHLTLLLVSIKVHGCEPISSGNKEDRVFELLPYICKL